MDQHANAWSRCLNSCLLTLATATLAIQKMGEQSVKEEVLESKEGATYFSGMYELVMSTFPPFSLPPNFSRVSQQGMKERIRFKKFY